MHVVSIILLYIQLFFVAPIVGNEQTDYVPCFPSSARSNQWYTDVASRGSEIYASNIPFPHIVIDNFFESNIAASVAAEFPRHSLVDEADVGYILTKIAVQYRKFELISDQVLGPATMFLIHQLKSSSFVGFLSKLTGIANLIPDPHYYGSGPHQTQKGGFLKIHADFNYHGRLGLWRRVNVFLYLNEDWESEWGGDLELWDSDLKGPVKAIAPIFNRLVVFTTSEKSFHGFPRALECPENVTRKSLAMYYYTSIPEPSSDGVPRETDFRPIAILNDGFTKDTQYQTVVEEIIL
jgi:hypothetical protein